MPIWYERQPPLARCPLFACRRSQTCRHTTKEDPCRRFHMGQDEAYTSWADDLDRRRREMIANRRPGEVVEIAEPGSPLAEERLSLLYRLLRARDQEHSAQLMAERARARKAQKGRKPASTSGDA